MVTSPPPTSTLPTDTVNVTTTAIHPSITDASSHVSQTDNTTNVTMMLTEDNQQHPHQSAVSSHNHTNNESTTTHGTTTHGANSGGANSTRTGASGGGPPLEDGSDDLCSIVTSSTYSTVQSSLTTALGPTITHNNNNSNINNNHTNVQTATNTTATAVTTTASTASTTASTTSARLPHTSTTSAPTTTNTNKPANLLGAGGPTSFIDNEKGESVTPLA